jgi:hypothetical protein
LQHVPPSYMGIDVHRLSESLRAHLINPRPHTPLISLGQQREKQEVKQQEPSGRTRSR